MEKKRQMDRPLQPNFVDTLPLDTLPTGQNTSALGTHEQKDTPWPVWQYLREMLEVAPGLGITVLASLFIPRNWAASELVFCAFFLVVFASAIRYRAATAYSGGVLAAVSYSLLLWQHPAWYVPFDMRYVFMEAFLLLSCGVCINTMLRAQRQRYVAAEQQQAQQDAILREQARTYQTALTLNAELERQIAGQTTTVTTISDRLAHLLKLKGDARYGAIVDLVAHALEAQSCALYVQRKGEMHFSACQPAGAHTSAPTLHLDDPLISSVLSQRQVRTVRDVLSQGQAVSQEGAVMAGPLLDQCGGVVGIVVIDTLPLLKFTPGAVGLFRSLLQLASLALQTALPAGEADQDASRSGRPLFPAEHSASTGPHTPLPEVDIDEETVRSLLSLYPTQHITTVMQALHTGDANDAHDAH